MTPGKWNDLLDQAIAIEGPVPVLRGLRLWGQVTMLKGGAGGMATLDAVERDRFDVVTSLTFAWRGLR